MIDYNICKEKLKSILSEKRFIHSVNVSKAAERLAIHYGVDAEKARIAGLLHDVCKEMDEKTLSELLSEAKPELFNAFKKFPFKLYHGPAATVYLPKEFGIDDEEILNSICFHTTGHKNMTVMEEIIFVADDISDERPFDNLKELQELTLKNINLVAIQKCTWAIQKCINKRITIHPYTVATYNDMIEKEGNQYDGRRKSK